MGMANAPKRISGLLRPKRLRRLSENRPTKMLNIASAMIVMEMIVPALPASIPTMPVKNRS